MGESAIKRSAHDVETVVREWVRDPNDEAIRNAESIVLRFRELCHQWSALNAAMDIIQTLSTLKLNDNVRIVLAAKWVESEVDFLKRVLHHFLDEIGIYASI